MGTRKSLIVSTGTGVTFRQNLARAQTQTVWGLLSKIARRKIDNPGTTTEEARREDIGVLNDVAAGMNAGDRHHVAQGDIGGVILNAGPLNS